MTIQRQLQQFPFQTGAGSTPSGLPINLLDIPSVTYNIIRTNGATLLTQINLQPQAQARWTIQELTIQGYIGAIASSLFSGTPSWARFGAVRGGLVINGNTLVPNSPTSATFTPIPDASLTVEIDQDVIDSINYQDGTFFSITYTPATPILLAPGIPLSAGIWMSPTVSRRCTLYVAGCSFSVVYDDGLKPTGEIA